MVVLGLGRGGTVVWSDTMWACSVADGELWLLARGMVASMGTGWPCWTAVMGRGVWGGGMVVPLLWLDMVGILQGTCLGCFCGSSVWECVWG